MPSWASSLIQKTEVLRTTLSQPRARGLSGKPVLTHLLQRPMGGQDGNPSGESGQTAVAFHPCLFHKPMPHGGNRHSLSVLYETPKGKSLWEATVAPSRPCADHNHCGYLRCSREPACGGYTDTEKHSFSFSLLPPGVTNAKSHLRLRGPGRWRV